MCRVCGSWSLVTLPICVGRVASDPAGFSLVMVGRVASDQV